MMMMTRATVLMTVKTSWIRVETLTLAQLMKVRNTETIATVIKMRTQQHGQYSAEDILAH